MPYSAATTPFSPRFWTLVGLIAFAVATRLVTHFAPSLFLYNFTPVESIALFGGAYFADRYFAIIVPLIAMIVADLIIGLHDLIPVVYGCIALTAWIGTRLRKKANASLIFGYSIGSAVLFFVVTNFFVWLTSGMYTLNAAGLVQCYVAAIPFFKSTLIGTLFWSAILFSSFAVLRWRFPILRAAASA